MGRPRLQTRQPETQRRHSAAIGRIASALGLIEIKPENGANHHACGDVAQFVLLCAFVCLDPCSSGVARVVRRASDHHGPRASWCRAAPRLCARCRRREALSHSVADLVGLQICRTMLVVASFDLLATGKPRRYEALRASVQAGRAPDRMATRE